MTLHTHQGYPDELAALAGQAIHPPEKRESLRELQGLFAIAGLPFQWRSLRANTRGNGQPVIVLPGFGMDRGSTWMMRVFLGRLGYDVHDWGLGRNHGNVWTLVPQIVERVEQLVMRLGSPVVLIGWSLGGFLAREAARDLPQQVTHVITMGSPVVGGPKYTLAAESYQQKGYDVDAIEAEVAARSTIPLQVPVTAIYSKRDGVVAWQACIDHVHPQTHHVEVTSTHMGLGFSAEVYRHIAQRLSHHFQGYKR
jgi:pimeloyl-ACP methyl ester carboxylesterase